MRQWLPVSTSAKGRLVVQALEAFGARRFEDVSVVELATAAGVTTGSLYHHFGSKLGLYAVVRADAERRLIDRMEGAVAASREAGVAEAVRAALVVGFDYVVTQGFLRLLGEPNPTRGADPVALVLARISDGGQTPIGTMLAAAWRAGVQAVADGGSDDRVRSALRAIQLDDAALADSDRGRPTRFGGQEPPT